MRKLIDLNDTTFERLSLMAIRSKTKLKNYIEHVLNNHADNGVILFGAGGSIKSKKKKINHTKPSKLNQPHAASAV